MAVDEPAASPARPREVLTPARQVAALACIWALASCSPGPDAPARPSAQGARSGSQAPAADTTCEPGFTLATIPAATAPLNPPRTGGFGFGATWAEFSSAHGPSRHQRCPLPEYRTIYYFQPIRTWNGHGYRFTVDAGPDERVLRLYVVFENEGGRGTVLTRGGPTIPPRNTGLRDARRQVLDLLPPGSTLLPGEVVTEPEGDMCLVQRVDAPRLEPFLHGDAVVVRFSSGQEGVWSSHFVHQADISIHPADSDVDDCWTRPLRRTD